jgi:hypothetical protein
VGLGKIVEPIFRKYILPQMFTAAVFVLDPYLLFKSFITKHVLKFRNFELGVVVHTCNPSYWGGRD